jgi:hyperosmotically inducible periplasmic protein
LVDHEISDCKHVAPEEKAMNKRTLRNASLVGALTALAATSWAVNEAPVSDETPSATTRETEALVADTDAQLEEQSPATEERIATDRVMPLEAAAIPAAPTATPVVETSAAQPPITVEAPRLSLDERIQSQVMDLLARAPDVSGRIGVESNDAVVTLSGYTTSAAQAQRAVRYAYTVDGVRNVNNEIRARVGGSL